MFPATPNTFTTVLLTTNRLANCGAYALYAYNVPLETPTNIQAPSNARRWASKGEGEGGILAMSGSGWRGHRALCWMDKGKGRWEDEESTQTMEKRHPDSDQAEMADEEDHRGKADHVNPTCLTLLMASTRVMMVSSIMR